MSSRRIGLCVIAGLSAVLTTAAFADNAERAVLQMEEARVHAMLAGNLPALSEFLSADLTYVHSGGQLETRSEFIERLKTGKLRYRRFDRQEVRARVYGKTAVVTGRAHVEVDADGGPNAFEIRFLDVWVRQNGRWQMVAWQSTRLTLP